MERRKWLTWAVGQEVADKIYYNIEHSETTSDRQCYFISGSFAWSSTKEGYDYWYSVNSKIKEYLAEKIDLQLIAFLRERDLWDKFIDNFNPLSEYSSYGLGDSFLWTTSAEGHDFWGKVADDYSAYYANGCCNHQDDELLSFINSSLTNKSKNDENQLQGEEDPRREGDGSEGSRICCKGDEPRFRLCYPLHRKRIDFQKREVGDFKVNISPRHPVLL